MNRKPAETINHTRPKLLMRVKTFNSHCATLALLLGGFTAQATLIGPTYPAPGGNGFSGAGSGAGQSGGVTWSYSGFDSSAFSQLYWGPWSSTSVASGLSAGGGAMTFSGISGNTAIWTGSASYYDYLLRYQTVATEFRATVNSAATPWVSAGSVDPALAGLGAFVNNSSGLNYSVTLQFLAGGIPIDVFEYNYDHGGSDYSSFSGGFYYAPPVPEPSTYIAGALMLLPFGATVIRSVRRKC